MYMILYSLLQEPPVHIGIEDEGRPTKTSKCINVAQLVQQASTMEWTNKESQNNNFRVYDN